MLVCEFNIKTFSSSYKAKKPPTATGLSDKQLFSADNHCLRSPCAGLIRKAYLQAFT